MKRMVINKEIILNKFNDYNELWSNIDYAYLDLQISEADISAIFDTVIAHVPSDLSYSIMSTIAEFDNLSDESMELIYKHGDIACKVAIALRNDLPPHIKTLCNNSSDKDVSLRYQ